MNWNEYDLFKTNDPDSYIVRMSSNINEPEYDLFKETSILNDNLSNEAEKNTNFLSNGASPIVLSESIFANSSRDENCKNLLDLI
jgi:hypothetical protein